MLSRGFRSTDSTSNKVLSVSIQTYSHEFFQQKKHIIRAKIRPSQSPWGEGKFVIVWTDHVEKGKRALRLPKVNLVKEERIKSLALESLITWECTQLFYTDDKPMVIPVNIKAIRHCLKTDLYLLVEAICICHTMFSFSSNLSGHFFPLLHHLKFGQRLTVALQDTDSHLRLLKRLSCLH